MARTPPPLVVVGPLDRPPDEELPPPAGPNELVLAHDGRARYRQDAAGITADLTFGSRPDGRWVLRRLDIRDEHVSRRLLSQIPIARLEAAVTQAMHRGVPSRPKLRVKVPEGGRYPDAFYERIAALYGWLAARSRRPAVELATANDVPVSTVHAWIKEARRRGLEPYGQRIPEEIRKMSDEEIMRRLAELRPEKYAAAYEEMHEEER